MNEYLNNFGLNVIDIAIPSRIMLFLKEMISPFSIFEYFCFIIWFLDEYVAYSLILIFLLLFSIHTSVKESYNQAVKMK